MGRSDEHAASHFEVLDDQVRDGCMNPMALPPDGTEIIAELSNGQPWWKLRAIDIAPWIRKLPKVIREDEERRLVWLGCPWDGKSDLPIADSTWEDDYSCGVFDPLVEDVDAWTGEVMKAGEISELLAAIGTLIADRPEFGIVAPTYRDVRSVLTGQDVPLFERPDTIVAIDFDIGEMILPLGIETWRLNRRDTPWMSEIAARIVQKLEFALCHKRKLLRRDRKMRSGFERDVGRIGRGAAPLWLRMEPLDFASSDAQLLRQPYVAFDVRLGFYGVWGPNGIEPIGSMRALKRSYSSGHIDHQLRAKRFYAMRESGIEGWITDVALAQIRLMKRSPTEMFREERKAFFDGIVGNMQEDKDRGYSSGFIFHDSVLKPHILFKNVNYQDGVLIIFGSYPEMFASAAVGRKLSDIFDHPAIADSGAVVERAEIFEGGLLLYHTPRLFSLEEAERAWLESESTAN